MNNLEEELLKLKGYGYQIWRYNLGHSILTFRGEHPDKKHHNVEITFTSVSYFQFPAGWDGDFYPVKDESELLEVLSRTGIFKEKIIMPVINQLFHLYRADSPYSTIYIIGHLAQIDYDVEPIYN